MMHDPRSRYKHCKLWQEVALEFRTLSREFIIEKFAQSKLSNGSVFTGANVSFCFVYLYFHSFKLTFFQVNNNG